MKIFNAIHIPRFFTVLALAGMSSVTFAVDFSYSGFANLTAGKAFGANGIEPSGSGNGLPDNSQWNCPCYIADWSHASVYESQWSLTPESRVGLQGTATVTPDLSFTGQVMTRYVGGDPKINLEWAFASYNLSPQLTFQIGRKRLPLFFYSDFQDVSFAYLWVRPNEDVYGWEVVNYNGANLTYRDDIGGWAVTANIYAGNENSKENPFYQLYSSTRTDVRWDHMMGIGVEVNRDWFTARASINKSKQRIIEWDVSGPVQVSPDPSLYGPSAPQTLSSLAFNIDKDNWIARTEFLMIDRSPEASDVTTFLASGGYRFGNFTPMFTMSRLNTYSSGDDPVRIEVDTKQTVTLRYQVNDNSALKVQADRSRWNYLDGTDTVRKLATISYEIIF